MQATYFDHFLRNFSPDLVTGAGLQHFGTSELGRAQNSTMFLWKAKRGPQERPPLLEQLTSTSARANGAGVETSGLQPGVKSGGFFERLD